MKKIIVIGISLYLILVCLITLDGIKNDEINLWSDMYYWIIYGNKIELNWEPSKRLQARLDTWWDLYNSKTVQKVVVSGWIWKEGFDEAEIMKDYLVGKWVQEADILVDSDGYTTRKTSENAWNMISMREENPENIWIIGVSQFYHTSRIKLSLRQVWFESVYWYAPKYFESRDLYSILREVPAYIKYTLHE